MILATGWDRVDPMASLVVAALIFWSSWVLLRESTRIFLEVAPSEIDPARSAQAIVAGPEVVEVHDLHVWTVRSGFPSVSAHVLVEAGADCHAIRLELEGARRAVRPEPFDASGGARAAPAREGNLPLASR